LGVLRSWRKPLALERGKNRDKREGKEQKKQQAVKTVEKGLREHE